MVDNIINFIILNLNGNEIKNNFLIEVNKQKLLCEKYDNSQFNKFYSILISQVTEGNIKYNHLLKEIEKVYENPNDIFYFGNIYNSSLKLKLEILNGKFNIFIKY